MVRWGKRRRSAGKETAATTDATTSVSDTGDATAGPGATSVTGYLGGPRGDASDSVHVSGTGDAQAGPGGFASTGPIIGSRITIGPGRPYRLERFSFAPTVDDQALPRVFADQPSRLLDARSQIVPFSGRQEELTRLAEWRDAGTASLSALLLHGPGGEGRPGCRRGSPNCPPRPAGRWSRHATATALDRVRRNRSRPTAGGCW